MTKENFIYSCLQFLKLPYIWGGDDPIKGFDCSGLAQEILAMIGLDPSGDQNAQMLHDYFDPLSEAGPRKTGTLYFYGKSKKEITHIAIGLDSMSVIEAGGGGSKTVNAEAAALQNAYVRVRPFNRRTDLVAVLNPKALPWRD